MSVETRKTPIWFWILAVIGLLWFGMGAFDYIPHQPVQLRDRRDLQLWLLCRIRDDGRIWRDLLGRDLPVHPGVFLARPLGQQPRDFEVRPRLLGSKERVMPRSLPGSG